jgi:hypothetical protein
VPDAAILIDNAIVYIEAKAGLFDESFMTVGATEVFTHKARALVEAVHQIQQYASSSNAGSLHQIEQLNRFGLIITSREVGVKSGLALQEMLPAGKLVSPFESGWPVALNHIYVLPIADFERIANACTANGMKLCEFLRKCVTADSDAQSAVAFVEQHLRRLAFPEGFSAVVGQAIDAAGQRLESAFEPTDTPNG